MVAKKLLVLLLFLSALFLISGCDEKTNLEGDLVVAKNNADFENTLVESQGEIKHVDLIAREWFYEPSEITVDKGDHVILSIASVGVNQGFFVKSLGIDEELVAGKTIVVEFDADNKGVYEISCGNHCQKESLAMDAKIIIK